MKAVCLLSGGMDSTTLLCEVLKNASYDEVIAVSFDYGQRHRERELLAQESICRLLGVRRKLISLDLNQIGGSPLVDMSVEVPDASAKQQESTVVPMRNTILLSFAAAYAITQDAVDLYFGACYDDQAAYPDCRPHYTELLARTFRVAHFEDSSIQLVHAPYWDWPKRKIVSRGLELGVPFSLTHTCYRGEFPACGTCDACVERVNAFIACAVRDPLPYEVDVYGNQPQVQEYDFTREIGRSG
jgi:7-cyano-7-deazaguanine synthase